MWKKTQVHAIKGEEAIPQSVEGVSSELPLLKEATWNINALRYKVECIDAWAWSAEVDVVLLQETRVSAEEQRLFGRIFDERGWVFWGAAQAPRSENVYKQDIPGVATLVRKGMKAGLMTTKTKRKANGIKRGGSSLSL